MSLILDALKKSENARQQKTGPALAAVPGSSGERGRSLWPWILAGVLLANAVLLVLLLTRSGEETAQTPTEAGANVPVAADPDTAEPVTAPPTRTPPAVASPEPAAQADVPAQSPPQDAPVMLARERRIQSLDSMVGRQIAPASGDAPSQPAGPARRGSVVYEGEPAAGGEQNRGGRVVYEGEPVADEPGPAPAPAPAQAPSPAAPATRLPSFQDLQLRGELSLAPMHIDIHVYSDTPSERFVFINMRKYKEGDKTSEGPVVERIDTTGAVLSHQGRRFLLPRD